MQAPNGIGFNFFQAHKCIQQWTSIIGTLITSLSPLFPVPNVTIHQRVAVVPTALKRVKY